jgi:TRAP-type C4-dicarboxylate transport system permease small subunit
VLIKDDSAADKSNYDVNVPLNVGLNATSTSRTWAKAALNVVDKLARLDGWLGALCLFLLCALMIAGIVIRTLSTWVHWLPRDIPIAWEYSSYLMAVTFTFGAALTLRSGGHIRVRVLLSNASPAFAKLLEMTAALAGLAFAVFFTWAMVHFSLKAFIADERSLASNTPLWIPQAFIALGALLLALQLLARLGQLYLGEPLEDKNIIR